MYVVHTNYISFSILEDEHALIKTGIIVRKKKYTDEKNYECDLCDFKACRPGILRLHLETKHPESAGLIWLPSVSLIIWKIFLCIVLSWNSLPIFHLSNTLTPSLNHLISLLPHFLESNVFDIVFRSELHLWNREQRNKRWTLPRYRVFPKDWSLVLGIFQRIVSELLCFFFRN